MDIKKDSIFIEFNRKTGQVNFNANIENRFQAKYMLDESLNGAGYNFGFNVSDENLSVLVSVKDGKTKIEEATGRSREEIRFLLKEALDIQRRIDLVNTYKLHYRMNYLMLCSIIDKYSFWWPIKRYFMIRKKYRPTKFIKRIADEVLSRAFRGEY